MLFSFFNERGIVMYTENATEKDKSVKVTLEFADGTEKLVDKDKAEEFIIKNIDKFDAKKFTPKGKRRAKA